MIALFDIGNTHTHIGLADNRRILRHIDLPTAGWATGAAATAARKFFHGSLPPQAALCSVAPAATPLVQTQLPAAYFVLTHRTAAVGIDYPAPASIGPDRLANAVAVTRLCRPPAVVVDFGTAVTFDVIDKRGRYIGGIIAPGLNVMTEYLHEKTALLPRIEIRDVKAVIGRNTTEAMLIGAVHGYRGLVRELIKELRKDLRAPRLPVIATGGYAKLIAAGLPEITGVKPLLTLEGLRLSWKAASCPT